MKKKALSLLLTLTMLLSLAPAFGTTASAAEAQELTASVMTVSTQWDHCYELTAGNYYLPDDLQLQYPIVIKGTGDTTIDLKGHVINGSAVSYDQSKNHNLGLINAKESQLTSLTICDTGTTAVHYFKYIPYADNTNTAWEYYDIADDADKQTATTLEALIANEPPTESKLVKMTGGCITGSYLANSAILSGWGNHSVTVNLTGGNIVGNRLYTVAEGGSYCAAICANGSGTVNISGGTVVGNCSQISSGTGAIRCGTFRMSGGTVAYNAGNAVSAVGATTVDMSGGLITRNRASETYCPVVQVNSAMTMTGGQIINNTGHGCKLSDNNSDVTITLGGTPVIKDNTANVEFPYNTERLRIQQNNHLRDGACVGISFPSDYGSGWYFSNNTAIASDANYIFSDNDNYSVVYDDTNQKLKFSGDTQYGLTINSSEHGSITAGMTQHIRAGKTVKLTVTPNSGYAGTVSIKDGNSADVTRTKVNATTYTFTMPASNVTVSGNFFQTTHWHEDTETDFTQALSGTATSEVTLGTAGQKSYYCLSSDYTNKQDTAITVLGTVYLCLNDCVLDLNGGNIKVLNGNALYIYDCGTTVRYFTDTTSPKDGCFETYSTTKPAGAEGTDYLKVTGGCITGGRGSGENGNKRGGAIYNFGTLTLHAGNIVGNEANYGGGVYNVDNGTKSVVFTMTGGSIVGNSAQNGGGVYNNALFFHFSGGRISCNSAAVSSGGVRHESGTMTMNGTAQITGNKGLHTGGITSSAVLELGGTAVISGNTANSAASNLTLWGDSQITLVNPAWTTPIGVLRKDYTNVLTGAITTSATTAKPTDVQYFTSDSLDYYVAYEDSALKLVESPATLEVSLTLDGTIGLNLFVTPKTDAANEISKYHVKTSFNNGHSVYEASYDTLTLNTGTQSKTRIASIYSYQMTIPVNIKVYYEDTMICNTDYRVQDYCDYVIAQTQGGDITEKLQTLCKTILDYGAEAQKYFADRTYSEGEFDYDYYVGTTPANVNVTDHPYNNVSRPTTYTAVYYVTNTAPFNPSANAYSLLHGSETGIKFYFLPTTGTIDDYEVKAYDNDFNELATDAFVVKAEEHPEIEGVCSVKIKNIKAYELNNWYYVSIALKSDKTNKYMQMGYSPMAYVNSFWQTASDSGLCKALAAYGAAAAAYVAKPE